MLAVWIPELPFQIARSGDPGLRERPLIFRAPAKGRTPTVWLADRLAKAAGIRADQPIETALRMESGLVVLDPAPSTWMDARNYLGGYLLRYSPIGKLGRLGEAYLDLRGTERIHGQALDAAEKVRLGLRDQGWASHEGLSLSLAAARVAARIEDQIRAVEVGAESRFLSPHPLSALPSLEPRSRDRLHHFGLQRIGQIQPIEPGTLERLMPRDQAILVLRQARGEDQENLPPLEIVRATETVRQAFHPPLPRYEVHLASWAWRSFWEWRLDGRHLLSTRLTWWDLDELHHQVKWTSHGEDLWTASQSLEAKFEAVAQRRVLIQRLELEAWLSPRAAPRPMIQEERERRLGALESVALRLHRRFGADALVLGMQS